MNDKKSKPLRHKCQVIPGPGNEQCEKWAQVKVHHGTPTHICTEHYLQFQSQGLVMGQPVLITFPKGKDGVF